MKSIEPGTAMIVAVGLSLSFFVFSALLFGATAGSAQDCTFGHRGDALRLSEALNSRDPVRISERVRAINPRMRAPAPEKREPGVEPAADAFSLRIMPLMRQPAVRLYLDAVRQDSWRLRGPTPAPPDIPRPLRRPTSGDNADQPRSYARAIAL